MKLLEQVNAISSHLPGSKLDKLRIHNEIQAYMAYFGLPVVYLTLNPSATHSPIFQVMSGNAAVDLTKRYPDIPSSVERVISVASDPVACTDFFDFSIESCFEQLFGWDHKSKKSKKSKKDGGILGHLHAFYGTAEYTKCGQLHGHFLIWLNGSLNPSDVHKRMKKDSEWRDHFFAFFEDIIHHQLPDVPFDLIPDQNPCSE